MNVAKVEVESFKFLKTSPKDLKAAIPAKQPGHWDSLQCHKNRVDLLD